MDPNTAGLTPELIEQWSKILNGVKGIPDVLSAIDTRVKKLEADYGLVQGQLSKLPKHLVPVPGNRWAGFHSDRDSDDGKKLFVHWIRRVAGKGKFWDDTPEEVKQLAMSENSDGAGGYLVPEIFIPELIRVIAEASVMRRLVRIIPMTTDISNLPTLVSSVSVYWQGTDNNTITESTPVFGPLQLQAKTLTALASCSLQVEEDSSIGLAELLTTLFGEGFGTEEDRVILKGNADPFDGVLFESGVNQVTMETSTFASVGFDDISKTADAISARSAVGASWFISRTMLGVLKRIRDLNHQYIWQNPAGDQPGRIWNYPYVECDQMPGLADTGTSTNFLAFGNPKNIMLGDRRILSIARSGEVGFKQAQVFFRAMERIAVAVAPVAAWARLRTSA